METLNFIDFLILNLSNMEPNDLKSNELCFELRSRGIEPKANQMLRRAQFRGILAKEREGKSYPTLGPFPFDEEAIEIEVTIKELIEMFSVDHVSLNDAELRRVTSRLRHVERRCSLLVAQKESDKEKMASFESHLLILTGLVLEHQDNTVSVPVASSTLNDHVCSVPNVKSVKPISVYKWNISFSGQPQQESLMSFLERVHELCDSRRVSEEDLFVSASDLFTGTALLWFRNIKHEVTSWAGVVACLKRDFLPVDYEDDLLREIRERTQGVNENVLCYIISMEALFNRLPTRPSSDEVIRRIKKNLNPYFSEKLVMENIRTLSDLKEKCRRVQELKTRNDRYQPPPSKGIGLLEPDLAYFSLDTERPRKQVAVNVVSPLVSSSLVCWNCGAAGHAHRECRAEKNVYCYGCGNKGVYKTSCTQCNSKNVLKGVTSQRSQESSTQFQGVTPSSIPLPPHAHNVVTQIPVQVPSKPNPNVAKFVPQSQLQKAKQPDAAANPKN